MNRHGYFIGWALLLVFGLPSTAGYGLHLFLPHTADSEDACACHDSTNCSVGHSSLPLGQTVGETNEHCGARCFLCRFFTRLIGENGSAPLSFDVQPVVRFDRIDIPFYPERPLSFSAGRSPPDGVTLV